MRTIFNFQFSIFNSKGFTLIELVVVFSILAILSTVGIVSFVSYNQIQSVQAGKNDLVNLLYLAKSRSFSQAVPSGCTQALNGYEVRICKLPASSCVSGGAMDYELLARCGDRLPIVIETRKLPQNVNITSSGTTSTSFLFPTIKGGVIGNGTVAIRGYNQSRFVTVSSTGNIQ